MIVWITGAPGAGKTTTANTFKRLLPSAMMLDGDEVREWLTVDCGFSPEDRLKHATRVYEVAKRSGNAIVSLVAHPPGPVDLLIWVDGPNRRGMWEGTTYQPPGNPDLVIRT